MVSGRKVLFASVELLVECGGRVRGGRGVGVRSLWRFIVDL